MISKAKGSDLEAILNIWLEASIKAHDFMPPEYWKSKIKDMREIYLPSASNYVFESNAEILGFVSMYQNTLAAIFVTPEQQGNGIGSALLEYIKTKYDELDLNVYKTNTSSINFYKKHGFVIVAEHFDEHTGRPEIEMKWQA